MIFFGTTFAQSIRTLNGTLPQEMKNIKNIKIENGIFDHLHGTEDVNTDDFTSEIVPGWNYATFIDANFNNTLFGGNVDFSVETTDEVRIKRRIKGSYN